MKINCRICDTKIESTCLDLNTAPPSNSFLNKGNLHSAEVYFPLEVYRCKKCELVQIPEYDSFKNIFSENYVYFSSFSKTWLEHSEELALFLKKLCQLDEKSLVVEVASNDGYLLQYFQKASIPCLGIEPTRSTADISKKKGINTLIEFFSEELAGKLVSQGHLANVIVCNNVYAHVPNIKDFTAGLKKLLHPDGVISIEFPSLLNLLKYNQFDTIYHEHFSYLSATSVSFLLKNYGLEIFDVQELKTHGGSYRLLIKHLDNSKIKVSENVDRILLLEKEYFNDQSFSRLVKETESIKLSFLNFLIEQKKNNKKVIGYGAAAKGNTLLNYCGVGKEYIEYVVDKSPYKQGLYLPGSRIPVLSEEAILETKPDFIVIFPWNIKSEITEQLKYVKNWGAKFITVIPNLTIFD